MNSFLDIQTFDSKLYRSKNQIDYNNQRAMQLQTERNHLFKRQQNLSDLNKQLKQKIQKDESKLLKNLKINKIESEGLMNDEKELLNLRNQRIQLINENQIIDSDLQKNQLFYEEIANQKKILKANLESILKQIEFQNEIKKSLTTEVDQILEGLNDYQSQNKALKSELNQVFGYIRNQTQDLFSQVKPRYKRKNSLL